jgi:hypothetical protein
MADEPTAALAVLTAGEVVVCLSLAALLAAGLVGDGGFGAGIARPLRLVALAALLVEAAIPAYVFVDARRRGIDGVWVHVAALPVVNVVGVAAYLLERERLVD